MVFLQLAPQQQYCSLCFSLSTHLLLKSMRTDQASKLLCWGLEKVGRMSFGLCLPVLYKEVLGYMLHGLHTLLVFREEKKAFSGC